MTTNVHLWSVELNRLKINMCARFFHLDSHLAILSNEARFETLVSAHKVMDPLDNVAGRRAIVENSVNYCGQSRAKGHLTHILRGTVLLLTTNKKMEKQIKDFVL